jgi:hypothetical protein
MLTKQKSRAHRLKQNNPADQINKSSPDKANIVNSKTLGDPLSTSAMAEQTIAAAVEAITRVRYIVAAETIASPNS